MGVEIEDAEPLEPRVPAESLGQALVGRPGDLVAAAEADREVPGPQDRRKTRSVCCLRCFERVALAHDVTRIVEAIVRATVPREVGGHAPQFVRTLGRTGAAVVTAHAGVAGEAEQRDAHAAR